jgi:hypothetical protein
LGKLLREVVIFPVVLLSHLVAMLIDSLSILLVPALVLTGSQVKVSDEQDLEHLLERDFAYLRGPLGLDLLEDHGFHHHNCALRGLDRLLIVPLIQCEHAQVVVRDSCGQSLHRIHLLWSVVIVSLIRQLKSLVQVDQR